MPENMVGLIDELLAKIGDSSSEPRLPDDAITDQLQINHMLSVLDHLTDMCMVMDRRLVINNEQPRLHAGCMNLFRHLMDEAQMTSERGYLTRSQCRSIWFHYNQLHQESKELNISMEDQLGWDPRENRTRAISSPVPLVGAQNRG